MVAGGDTRRGGGDKECGRGSIYARLGPSLRRGDVLEGWGDTEAVSSRRGRRDVCRPRYMLADRGDTSGRGDVWKEDVGIARIPTYKSWGEKNRRDCFGPARAGRSQ